MHIRTRKIAALAIVPMAALGIGLCACGGGGPSPASISAAAVSGAGAALTFTCADSEGTFTITATNHTGSTVAVHVLDYTDTSPALYGQPQAVAPESIGYAFSLAVPADGTQQWTARAITPADTCKVTSWEDLHGHKTAT